ncbi:hypothetical protein LCGC14_2951330 [marine sediment metagenome]|uniref:Uncharacterized protein n=1 Tax=marine sediment metagenome TaxID=412755 RepID=A0A0F8XEX1_9ZZZZ
MKFSWFYPICVLSFISGIITEYFVGFWTLGFLIYTILFVLFFYFSFFYGLEISEGDNIK